MWADSEYLMALGEPTGTQHTVEGHPFVHHGLVRQVELWKNDLPLRCVTYSRNEMLEALKSEGKSISSNYMHRLGWPTPKYLTDCISVTNGSKLMVYTHPEMGVLWEAAERMLLVARNDLETVSRIARRVTKSISEVRRNIEGVPT